MLRVHRVADGDNTLNDEIYEYEEVYPSSLKPNEENRLLRNLHENIKGLELSCICLGWEISIPLRVSYKRNKEYNKNTYYLANLSVDFNHADSCQFAGIKSENRHSWISNGSDIDVSIKLPRNKPSGSNAGGKGNTSVAGGRNGVSQVDKTLNGFIRQLLSESWDHANNIKKKEISEALHNGNRNSIKAVSLKETFLRMIDKIKHIKINSKYKLSDLMTKDSPIQFKFILLLLDTKDNIKDNTQDTYKIILKNIIKDEDYHYTCRKDIFNSALNDNTVKDSPFVVGAFVKKGTSEIVDCALVPISDNGVWVESSYEKELYNILHMNNRLFRKPYKSYADFNHMKIDGLLIDTKDKKGTILEVFGESESNIQYHIRRGQKIELFDSLSTKGYGFWYWDAFKEGIGNCINNLPEQTLASIE